VTIPATRTPPPVPKLKRDQPHGARASARNAHAQGKRMAAEAQAEACVVRGNLLSFARLPAARERALEPRRLPAHRAGAQHQRPASERPADVRPMHSKAPPRARASSERRVRVARCARSSTLAKTPWPRAITMAWPSFYDARPVIMHRSHAHHRPTRIVGFQGAIPVTHLNIGGTKADAIAARIVHQLCGALKSHRPAVEQTGDEGCRLMAAQP